MLTKLREPKRPTPFPILRSSLQPQSAHHEHNYAPQYPILVAANREGSLDFRDVDYSIPTALVVGAEWDGISEMAIDGATHTITVPMLGMGESLNVSVATAVILFEAQRQRREKGMYHQTRLRPECFDKMLFEFAYPRLSRELREKGTPYPSLDEQGGLLSP